MALPPVIIPGRNYGQRSPRNLNVTTPEKSDFGLKSRANEVSPFSVGFRFKSHYNPPTVVEGAPDANEVSPFSAHALLSIDDLFRILVNLIDTQLKVGNFLYKKATVHWLNHANEVSPF